MSSTNKTKRGFPSYTENDVPDMYDWNNQSNLLEIELDKIYKELSFNWKMTADDFETNVITVNYFDKLKLTSNEFDKVGKKILL